MVRMAHDLPKYEDRRMNAAMDRVLPLRDPMGVKYGYMVRSYLGVLEGIFRSESEALKRAIKIEGNVSRRQA